MGSPTKNGKKVYGLSGRTENASTITTTWNGEKLFGSKCKSMLKKRRKYFWGTKVKEDNMIVNLFWKCLQITSHEAWNRRNQISQKRNGRDWNSVVWTFLLISKELPRVIIASGSVLSFFSNNLQCFHKHVSQ